MEWGGGMLTTFGVAVSGFLHFGDEVLMRSGNRDGVKCVGCHSNVDEGWRVRLAGDLYVELQDALCHLRSTTAVATYIGCVYLESTNVTRTRVTVFIF